MAEYNIAGNGFRKFFELQLPIYSAIIYHQRQTDFHRDVEKIYCREINYDECVHIEKYGCSRGELT